MKIASLICSLIHIKNPTAPSICCHTTLWNISVSKTSHERQITSVAAYLRYSGVVNNQIKKRLLLSLRVKKIKISEYLAKIHAKTWLSCALSSSLAVCWQVRKVHETTTLLLVTLPNIRRWKKLNRWIYSIDPSLFHCRLKTFRFSKSFPLQPFFSSSGLTPRIRRIVYRYFWAQAYPFFTFYFFCFPLFSCWFRAVD